MINTLQEVIKKAYKISDAFIYELPGGGDQVMRR